MSVGEEVFSRGLRLIALEYDGSLGASRAILEANGQAFADKRGGSVGLCTGDCDWYCVLLLTHSS